MRTFLFAVLLTVSASLSAQTKAGHINSLELLSKLPEITKVDSSLQELANQLQVQYNSYLKEYQTKVGDYNANSAGWTEVKKEASEQDITALQKRITDFETSSQNKIEKRKEELYTPILDKANAAITKVGKDNKFTFIIDSSEGTLLYTGDDMIDIMQLVLKEMKVQ